MISESNNTRTPAEIQALKLRELAEALEHKRESVRDCYLREPETPKLLRLAADVLDREQARAQQTVPVNQGQGKLCECGHHRLYHVSVGNCMVLNCPCAAWTPKEASDG